MDIQIYLLNISQWLSEVAHILLLHLLGSIKSVDASMNEEKNKYTRGMKDIKRKPVDTNMNKR